MLEIRINPSPPQAPASLIDAYRSVVAAHISDNLSRLPAVVGLVPYHRGGKLVGTALTVKTRPGDNLMIHKAFDLARPGDVMVVDGGGDVSQALVGELMKAYAESIGMAGFVIDGAIRDVAAFRSSDFPCYARGVTHKGPYKDGPGEINVPVTVGGLIIGPGDIIVGDEDGVVAVPQAIAVDLLGAIRAQEKREQETLQAIKEGRYDRSWIAAKIPPSAVRT